MPKQSAAAKRAKRHARLVKLHGPSYGKRTAAATGGMGYQRFGGGTKPPPKTAVNVVVIRDPQRPETHGRVVRIGKRGGAYGQGGNPSSRWGELGTMKGIISALPAAALATAGAAMIVPNMLAGNATYIALRKKTPGGGNGLAFIGGAATAWIAYKYRSLIFFLTGMGVAAYALIKFSDKESKLDAGDEDDQLDADSTAQLPPAPDAPLPVDRPQGKQPVSKQNAPAPDTRPSADQLTPAQKTSADISRLANKQFDAGNWEASAILSQSAIDKFNDPLYWYNMARARHKLAESLFDVSQTRSAEEAQKALDAYSTFIETPAANSVMASKETILGLKQQAKKSWQTIHDFIEAQKKGGAESEAFNLGINGTRISVAGDEDEDDVSGDDDQDEDDDEDEDDDGVGDGYDDDE